MKQSRKSSLAETLSSVVIGFGVAMVGQAVIFPVFDIHIGIVDNLGIAAFFTAVGVARMYAVRRLFEHFRYTGVMK